MRTRIKICGITNFDDASAAVEAGADALGFVFVRESPRFIEPGEAWEIVGALPPFVSTVGLFRNEPLESFCDVEQVCPTTCVQLHGTEPVKLVEQCGPGVIKGVRFDAGTIAAEVARWSAVEGVDAVLVDGGSGGQGVTFDWSILAEQSATCDVPIIVAGGLTAENVGEAVRAARPFAVDVSSGVEREPGKKDAARMRAFCDAVRAADSKG